MACAPPPRRPVSNAMTAKVGAAARHTQLLALRAGSARHCSRVSFVCFIIVVHLREVSLFVDPDVRSDVRGGGDGSSDRPPSGASDKCDGISMDSLITAAARALATGDPLGALNRVALRDDAPALALRGIAMAQLGDLARAKALLRSAVRAFGPKEVVSRARCVVAEAEIALACRDLGWPAHALAASRATLEAHGDRVNAAHAGYVAVRRLLLIGRLDEPEAALA